MQHLLFLLQVQHKNDDLSNTDGLGQGSQYYIVAESLRV